MASASASPGVGQPVPAAPAAAGPAAVALGVPGGHAAPQLRGLNPAPVAVGVAVGASARAPKRTLPSDGSTWDVTVAIDGDDVTEPWIMRGSVPCHDVEGCIKADGLTSATACGRHHQQVHQLACLKKRRLATELFEPGELDFAALHAQDFTMLQSQGKRVGAQLPPRAATAAPDMMVKPYEKILKS